MHLDKTLTESSCYADAKAVGDALATKLTAPSTASVGQTIVVKTVDDSGAPIKWECVDMSSDNIYVQNDEPTDAPDGTLWVDMDEEGSENNPGEIDLSIYATKEFVNNAIEGIEIPEVDLTGYAKTEDVPTDDYINSLINTALGVIENGTY